MHDIAVRVGVSRVAVSYALNGRPGVSAELRERVLAVARELGFRPHGPAVALHHASAAAVGLVLRRVSPALSTEVFRRHLISGIERRLSVRGFGLALQFVADAEQEMAVYRRWRAERRVDGVIVGDLWVGDPRPALLREIGLPAVVVGGDRPTPGLACLWTDEDHAAAAIAAHLGGHGHRRVARVTGPAAMQHTRNRTAAFLRAGLDAVVVAGDHSAESGARLTRRLLGGARPPTAIVYDNDLMALAGLGVAAGLGVRVPAELSVLAWEDSPLCEVVHPAVTVVRRSVSDYGARAVDLLFAWLDGAPPAPERAGDATLVVRASTGPAPGGTADREPA